MQLGKVVVTKFDTGYVSFIYHTFFTNIKLNFSQNISSHDFTKDLEIYTCFSAHKSNISIVLCPASVCLSIPTCVCLSSSHTFLVVMHSYVLQVTRACLGMLPLCFILGIYFGIIVCCHVTSVRLRDLLKLIGGVINL